jgi:hypothetical protein
MSVKSVNSAAVCTLFEGHYHCGLGALANSLYAHGFRGTVWAGYRGDLPHWAQPNESREGHPIFKVSDDCTIRFVPLQTERHLTNYKPDFMRSVLSLAPDTEAIYYFDPDITVAAPWSFFGEWVSYGVALCEDVNSPLYENQPRRAAWRRHYGLQGMPLTYKGPQYANGGFQGIARSDFAFLQTWQKAQELMAPMIGGLEKSMFSNASLSPDKLHHLFPFNRTDQDALNVAVEATDRPVSIMGKDAMGFVHGGLVMPHALGSAKPWGKNYLLEAMAGRPPTPADRSFWEYAAGPAKAVSGSKIVRTKASMAVAAALSRFIRRA